MATRFFTFVQLELPWELGLSDGRYLLRTRTGEHTGEPEHVVVLSTVGAERRRLLGNRARSRPINPEPQPTRVPVARATIIDAVGLATEQQAANWLEQLDPELEAARAARVLNRMLFAQRIAAAEPYTHEISARQALVIRAGFGEGDQVADGFWSRARELSLSRRRARRPSSALRPQERLAVLLSGRGEALACEELALRARLDLEQDRPALAAIELRSAYASALRELPAEKRPDLNERIGELRELSAGLDRCVEEPSTGEGATRHALERLEAALRARTATGFAALQ